MNEVIIEKVSSYGIKVIYPKYNIRIIQTLNPENGQSFKDDNEIFDYLNKSVIAGISDNKDKEDFINELKKILEVTESQEDIIKKYTDLVQERLDNFAKTRNYDSIASACTYYNSTNEKFRQEAHTCVRLRDETWSKCYELLDLYLGENKIPTFEELESELPKLEW